MNVHIYLESSFPEGMAATKRVACYAKGLTSVGALVDVVCTHRIIERQHDESYPEKGIYESIPYSYSSGKYKSANKFFRGLDWIVLDAFRAYLYVLRSVGKDDVILVYGYSIFMQLAIILAARKVGAKVVKETCEHPSSIVNMSSAKNRMLKRLEYRYIMPLYDGFIAISRSLENFCIRYKRKNAKVIIVPILVEDKSNIDFSNRCSPYQVPYIIHTGTMLEQKDSISKILLAFSKFKRETNSQCKLVFTGPQAMPDCTYIPMIKELQIEKDVELLGFVSTEEIQVLQHFAAFTIIYKSDNLQARNCFPTKLGEMLIASVPVITTNVGDANFYLENAKNAYIVNDGDYDQLVHYMDELINNKEKAIEIGRAGRTVAITSFNPKEQGKRLMSFLNSLY